MKACVIGHPIVQSKSPIIHQYWLAQNNIEGSYEAVEIKPEDLKQEIKKLIAQNYDGFNVTAPHKETVLKLCDSLDKTAQKIGAVNTVVIKEGKLHGQNTDAFGFIQNIKSEQPDFDFEGKTALVLGAGGAARAIIYGLIDAGVAKITLCNRTPETAEKLAKMDQDIMEAVAWDERSQHIDNIDILINTTSLGMDGKPPLEMDLSALPKQALVSDIVYAPLRTPLLKDAQERGNDIVHGIGMLLHQARPAFGAWTGILPTVTEDLRTRVLG